jgi:hypothetical protein
MERIDPAIVIDLIRAYEWHEAPTLRDPELTDAERARIHERALAWVASLPEDENGDVYL